MLALWKALPPHLSYESQRCYFLKNILRIRSFQKAYNIGDLLSHGSVSCTRDRRQPGAWQTEVDRMWKCRRRCYILWTYQRPEIMVRVSCCHQSPLPPYGVFEVDTIVSKGFISSCRGRGCGSCGCCSRGSWATEQLSYFPLSTGMNEHTSIRSWNPADSIIRLTSSSRRAVAILIPTISM